MTLDVGSVVDSDSDSLTFLMRDPDARCPCLCARATSATEEAPVDGTDVPGAADGGLALTSERKQRDTPQRVVKFSDEKEIPPRRVSADPSLAVAGERKSSGVTEDGYDMEDVD